VEFISGGVFVFELFLLFLWFWRFSFYLLALLFFLLLDDLLEPFLAIDLLAVLHGVLNLNFKLCAFVVNVLIKGEIKKPSGQFLSSIVMSHWLAEVCIWIWDISVILSLSLFHVENHVCLSRGVQVTGAAWRVVMKIMAGVGDLVQRTGDGHTGQILDGQTIGRSVDTVRGLYHAWRDEERMFLGWASKPWSTVCQWFFLKTNGTVSPGLVSKLVATVSPDLASKLVVKGFLVWALKPTAQFGDLGLKITMTVSWFAPQNQASYGLSVAPQNRSEDEDNAGHTSRSSGLLHVESCQRRVSQSGFKISGGAMAAGARGTITEITWGSSRRRMDRCNEGALDPDTLTLPSLMYYAIWTYSLLVFYLGL
jgi:hypothetical protein